MEYRHFRNVCNLPSCSPSEVSEHIHRRHTVANGQGSFSVGSADHPNFVEAVSNIKAMKSFSTSPVYITIQLPIHLLQKTLSNETLVIGQLF